MVRSRESVEGVSSSALGGNGMIGLLKSLTLSLAFCTAKPTPRIMRSIWGTCSFELMELRRCGES